MGEITGAIIVVTSVLYTAYRLYLLIREIVLRILRGK